MIPQLNITLTSKIAYLISENFNDLQKLKPGLV